MIENLLKLTAKFNYTCLSVNFKSSKKNKTEPKDTYFFRFRYSITSNSATDDT